MRVRFGALILVLAMPARPIFAQGSAPQAVSTDVPVKSVVLFSSGVGYFEHAGTVHGNGSTELRFKTAQINDILKSLVLQDQDGGRVTTITYPSQDPISKTLRSFQVDITNNPGMAALLNQLRGTRITVQAQTERMTGTILGVEMLRKPVDKGEPIETPTLNLLTGAMMRSIELRTISSLTLDDPRLQEELTKALAAVSQARDQDKKPVTISFAGTGERRVRIGYVIETPIWKTSYRLMLTDKSARLQGWAIVENQTESDWNGVSLSLVSGRPISFIMDLYQPLYLQRPTVIPEQFAGLRPQLYGAALPIDRVSTALALQPGKAEDARGAAANKLSVAPNGFEEAAVTTGAEDSTSVTAQGGIINFDQSVRSIATSAQLGDLFQYSIPNVTLARQKSAMLPIVTDTVAIERLSIYNASVLPRNPLNGVRLTNTTGKHLQQGPVTVLDQNVYAGDARIDNVPPGQQRLLSYGVDLELVVDNSRNVQEMAVVTGKINKGALIVSRKFVSSQDYQVDNKGTRDKMIVVEHPVRQGWDLVETMKPVEATPTTYRFQGTAAAGKVTVLQVREESVRQQSISLLPAGVGELVTYSRSGEIPETVRNALTRAIQLKQAVADVETQMNGRIAEINDITREQQRIRENMKTVGQKTQYYGRLLAKLNEQESTIERLQQERDDLLAKRDAQRRVLEDYLNGLTAG